MHTPNAACRKHPHPTATAEISAAVTNSGSDITLQKAGASIPAQTCGQAGPGLRMSDPQLQPSGFSPIYSCPHSSLNHDRDSLLPEAQSNRCSAGPHEKEGRGVGLSVLQRDSLRRSNFNNWKQVSSQTLLTSQCKHN